MRSPPSSYHALVLATFPGDRQGLEAQAWRGQLVTLLPAVAGTTHIHVDDRGAMVLHGRYDQWDDPQAQEDMAALGGLRINGQRVLGPIIMTRVQPPRDPSTIGPWELVGARLRYPDVRGLYSLEIAIWGDFESGQLPAAQRRSEAEREVRELRAAGLEAYYHHDEAQSLSTVTIGLFDDRAIDPRSGIATPRLERLREQFPLRMVNGEPLRIPVKSTRVKGATRQQPSRLVEVPRV